MALTVSVDEIVHGSRNSLLGVRPHWKRIRLREIASVLNGGAFKSTQFTKGDGVPLIRIRDVGSDVTDTNYVGEFDERYIVEPGDLLIGMDGDFNCARWRGPRGLLNQRVCKVTLHGDQYHPRYLDFALPGYLKAINDATSSVTVKHLSSRTVEDIPLPFPSLHEQDEIVAELEKQFSRLDEAVANLKRVKANLKRQAAAILSAAIGGELLERTVLPANTERPEFAPAIDLPSGWSWASTAEVCEVVASGSTPKPEEMASGAGEVPFIKVYNLGFDGSLDFTLKPTFIRRAIHDGQLARSRCLAGDVLMNIVGPPLGKVSLVPDSFPEWNINQAIVTFRVGPRILNHLLAYWLMAPPVQRRIERTSKATAGQFNVQVSTCRKLVLPLPPLGEQARIVAEVDRRLSIVREVEAEVDANLKRAQALRQAVLTRAFSGAPPDGSGTTGPRAMATAGAA
ncbi:restriction endonuclease subunit S [Accumulibacter sp.]|uniref:restriction endonuclease subunit S n=1 Tax=Accumulibacter sp. TaxID=2053492 RepID=UPI00159A7ADF|nr:MAG: restriction endonuclease subunit S [Candidatus Accumulibacter similis]